MGRYIVAWWHEVKGLLLCLVTAVGLTLFPVLTAMPFFFNFLPLLLLPLSCKCAMCSIGAPIPADY